jgi:hypothetical protein
MNSFIVTFEVKAFWVVMPHSVAVGYQCFGGPCCLRLQGETIFTLKMEAARYSETVVFLDIFDFCSLCS